MSSQFGLGTPLFSGSATGWPFRAGHWNWLTALVQNPLDRELDATLVFRTVVPSAAGQFNLSKSFRVPAHANLEVAMPVRVPSVLAFTKLPIDFELELLSAGEVQDRRKASASSMPENIHALALWGDRADLDFVLNGKSPLAERSPQLVLKAEVRTASVADHKIPDDPMGLDFFDSVILVHPGRHPLRAMQWAAIEQWLRGGGRLIVVPGADDDPRRQPELDALMPVDLVGSRQVTAIPALADWVGEQWDATDPIVVREAVVRHGEVMLRDGENPLVVTARHGLGSVTYVAVDQSAALSGMPAMQKFWLAVLRHLLEPDPVDIARLEGEVPDLVEQFAGREVVGVWLPVSVLAGYLGVLVAMTKLRWRFSSEAVRWTGVCLAAVLFSVLSYLVAWAAGPRAQSTIYDIWVACGGPAEITKLADYISVLPTRRGQETVQIDSRHIQIVPGIESGGSVVNAQVRPTGTTVQFFADKADLRTLAFGGYARIGGLEAHGTAGANGIELRVANRSPFDLQATFFKLGRRIVPIGDLPRAQERRITVEAATESPGDPFESAPVLDASTRLRQSILRSLFVDSKLLPDNQPLLYWPRGMKQGTSSQSLFAGWTDQPLTKIAWSEAISGDRDIVPAQRVRAVGLLAVTPSFEVGEDEFLVPAGAMRLGVPDGSVTHYYFGESSFRGYRPVSGSALTLLYDLPAWARPASIRQAVLSIQFVADAYRLRVFLGDDELPLPEVPYGKFALPASSLSKDSAGLTLRLEVEPRMTAAGPVDWHESQWFVRQVEVECLCSRRRHDSPDAPGQPPGGDYSKP